MNKVSSKQKKAAKKAAYRYYENHWLGKFTQPVNLMAAFLAGVNYQRQLNEGTESSKPTSITDKV